MIQKIEHYTDFLLTQEYALQQLKGSLIGVTWYTNQTTQRSIVHSHPFYEIVLSISGTDVLYSADGNVYVLHSGEAIIFPRECYHSGACISNSDASERLVVQIDGDFWESTARSLGVHDTKWNNSVTLLNRDAVKYWNLRGLFERMHLNKSFDERFRSTAFLCNLTELFMIICQTEEKSSIYSPSASNTLVEKAVHYIQEHYTEPDLNVNTVIEYVYISRGHLSRVFKEYTTKSIHGYITELRMQHCRQLIADGKSILDACNESGFSDYSSFYKTFRKLYGVTPVMYRSKLKALHADKIEKSKF